jgi:REP element-mobilizing transposase RayT
MTTRWRPDFDPDHLYFVTTTAAQRHHVFRSEIVKRLVVDSLYYVSLMNHVRLYAFVIMPNHLHVIMQCPPDFPPKDWVRALKGGISRLIIRHYQATGNQRVLAALAELVTRPGKQAYKVWEDGYLAKAVLTPAFLQEKLTYIHNNPVQPYWLLVDKPEDYAWSSAGFYLLDSASLIPVEDARALLA